MTAKVTQADIEFILDVLRRSRRWLTASQIAHYSRDRKTGDEVWSALDVMVANSDGCVCRAIYKGHYVYQSIDKMDALPKTATLLTMRKPVVTAQDARKQAPVIECAGLYRLPFYHPLMQ